MKDVSCDTFIPNLDEAWVFNDKWMDMNEKEAKILITELILKGIYEQQQKNVHVRDFIQHISLSMKTLLIPISKIDYSPFHVSICFYHSTQNASL